MIIALVGGTFISLGCVYAALSWMVPAYLLKPPPDDPDGEPRLTMPEIKNGAVAVLIIVVAVFVVLVLGSLAIPEIP